MSCSQCGNQVAEGSASCPRCGAPVAGAAPRPASTPGVGGAGPGAAAQGFSFDAARLSQADRIAGAATVVLLVSLFLPWFTASAGPFGSGSASGMTVHSYLWVVFLLCLGIIAFLVLGAGFAEVPFRLPVPRATILLVATGLNLLIVLLAFFTRPNGFGLVTISWSFGAFIALIAAIAACVPLAAPLLRAQGGR
jgi:zinc-ribbon domain